MSTTSNTKSTIIAFGFIIFFVAVIIATEGGRRLYHSYKAKWDASIEEERLFQDSIWPQEHRVQRFLERERKIAEFKLSGGLTSPQESNQTATTLQAIKLLKSQGYSVLPEEVARASALLKAHGYTVVPMEDERAIQFLKSNGYKVKPANANDAATP